MQRRTGTTSRDPLKNDSLPRSTNTTRLRQTASRRYTVPAADVDATARPDSGGGASVAEQPLNVITDPHHRAAHRGISAVPSGLDEPAHNTNTSLSRTGTQALQEGGEIQSSAVSPLPSSHKITTSFAVIKTLAPGFVRTKVGETKPGDGTQRTFDEQPTVGRGTREPVHVYSSQMQHAAPLSIISRSSAQPANTTTVAQCSLDSGFISSGPQTARPIDYVQTSTKRQVPSSKLAGQNKLSDGRLLSSKVHPVTHSSFVKNDDDRFITAKQGEGKKKSGTVAVTSTKRPTAPTKDDPKSKQKYRVSKTSQLSTVNLSRTSVDSFYAAVKIGPERSPPHSDTPSGLFNQPQTSAHAANVSTITNTHSSETVTPNNSSAQDRPQVFATRLTTALEKTSRPRSISPTPLKQSDISQRQSSNKIVEMTTSLGQARRSTLMSPKLSSTALGVKKRSSVHLFPELSMLPSAPETREDAGTDDAATNLAALEMKWKQAINQAVSAKGTFQAQTEFVERLMNQLKEQRVCNKTMAAYISIHFTHTRTYISSLIPSTYLTILFG